MTSQLPPLTEFRPAAPTRDRGGAGFAGPGLQVLVEQQLADDKFLNPAGVAAPGRDRNPRQSTGDASTTNPSPYVFNIVARPAGSARPARGPISGAGAQRES